GFRLPASRNSENVEIPRAFLGFHGCAAHDPRPRPEGFRVKTKIRQQLANRKRRIARRLDKTNVPNCQRPAFTARDIHYEIADRSRGLSSGGIRALPPPG